MPPVPVSLEKESRGPASDPLPFQIAGPDRHGSVALPAGPAPVAGCSRPPARHQTGRYRCRRLRRGVSSSARACRAAPRQRCCPVRRPRRRCRIGTTPPRVAHRRLKRMARRRAAAEIERAWPAPGRSAPRSSTCRAQRRRPRAQVDVRDAGAGGMHGRRGQPPTTPTRPSTMTRPTRRVHGIGRMSGTPSARRRAASPTPRAPCRTSKERRRWTWTCCWSQRRRRGRPGSRHAGRARSDRARAGHVAAASVARAPSAALPEHAAALRPRQLLR